MGKLISFVIPSYNEESNLREIHRRIVEEMKKNNFDFEVIFVDDGSKDKTFYVASDIAKESNVIAIKFSRNFGKEAAIFCGLAQAKGDAVIVMDADLQHPVSIITTMIEKWQEGHHIVEARKQKRQNESSIYRFFSNLFYRLLNKMSGMNLNNLSDFKLLDRCAVDILNQLTERQTFFRALSGWMGYNSCFVEFEVAERFSGSSKWSFSTLFKYAINNICSFSSVPLQFVTIAGMIFMLFSLILGINTLYNYFSGHALSGFTTVILLTLILGSVLLLSLGIIGYYLSKIYEEIKGRPRYIIQQIIKKD